MRIMTQDTTWRSIFIEEIEIDDPLFWSTGAGAEEQVNVKVNS